MEDLKTDTEHDPEGAEEFVALIRALRKESSRHVTLLMDTTTPAVVDTDVVSFLFKNHSLAPAYQAILAERPLAVSLITLAEIEYGMQAKTWGANGRDQIRRFSRPLYDTITGHRDCSPLGADQSRLCEERPTGYIRRCLYCSGRLAVEWV